MKLYEQTLLRRQSRCFTQIVRDETIDLCYIDPPFNSKRNYNQIYNNLGGEDRAQAQAFVDTWTWDDHANICFDEILTNKNGVQTQQSIALVNGLERVLGKGALFAYLVSIEQSASYSETDS